MLNHAAIWVVNLETICAFYERYFSARRGAVYTNAARGFRSCFLAFGEGARLEVMCLEQYTSVRVDGPVPGYAHISLSLGSTEAVDRLANELGTEGFRIVDGPRWTGDGYYECVVLDPEGNPVEFTR